MSTDKHDKGVIKLDYINPVQPKRTKSIVFVRERRREFLNFKEFSFVENNTTFENFGFQREENTENQSKEESESIKNNVEEEIDRSCSPEYEAEEEFPFELYDGDDSMTMKVDYSDRSDSPCELLDMDRMKIKFSMSKHSQTKKYRNKRGEIEVKVIGRGRFGKNILVYDNRSGILMTKKYLKKEFISDQEFDWRVSSSEQSFRKLAKEIDLIKKFHHPFIVPLRKITQSERCVHLYFDYVPGNELFFHRYHNNNLNFFTMDRIKVYGAQMASIVGHIHKKGGIIRDLKPENFVLDEFGNIIFVSLPLHHAYAANTTFSGTPEYIAPEILIGSEDPGNAVDWWNVGLLIYELCFGLPPFYSENMNEIYDNILNKPLSFPSNNKYMVIINKKRRKHEFELLKDLLKKLLMRDHKKRLGYESDLEEVKAHPYFKGINWERMENKFRNNFVLVDPDEMERMRYVIDNFSNFGRISCDDSRLKSEENSRIEMCDMRVGNVGFLQLSKTCFYLL